MKQYVGTYGRVFEIGDSLTKPAVLDNVTFDIPKGEFMYMFDYAGLKYAVGIHLLYSGVDPLTAAMKVDFATVDETEKTYELNASMTNAGKPLTVLSSVTWTVMYFIRMYDIMVKAQGNKYAQYTSLVLNSIVINAKSEGNDPDDDRRAKLDNAYVNGALSNMGVSIISSDFKKGTITDEDGNVLNVVHMEYDIRPIAISEISKAIKGNDTYKNAKFNESAAAESPGLTRYVPLFEEYSNKKPRPKWFTMKQEQWRWFYDMLYKHLNRDNQFAKNMLQNIKDNKFKCSESQYKYLKNVVEGLT